jgi:hypothetical protein
MMTLGTALYLYGMIGPDHGSASVEVDGQIVAPHLNLTVSDDSVFNKVTGSSMIVAVRLVTTVPATLVHYWYGRRQPQCDSQKP